MLKIFSSENCSQEAELESYAAANCLESLSQKLLSEWNDHLQLRAVSLHGQVHGDLNEHNVIVQRLPGGMGYQFSLIDFEQYRSQAPLLFDQAYLLLCLLLQDAACYTLIEWSEKIEAFFNGLRALLRSLGIPAQELADAPSLQASAGENSELWRQVDRFSFDNRYILLSVCGEEKGAGEVMQRLSPIKWPMVVEMNDLTDNPIRGRVLSMYKRVQGYRVYSIPTEEQHVFEPAPAWLHLNVFANQKNQKLYYARYFQKELQRCLGAVLSLRENEPFVIIADFKEDNLTVGQMLLQDILLCAGENTPVHIVSLNGISLDLDSEELLQCTVSPSTLEQLSQSVHLLFEARLHGSRGRV